MEEWEFVGDDEAVVAIAGGQTGTGAMSREKRDGEDNISRQGVIL